jgi:hypothetical protein
MVEEERKCLGQRLITASGLGADVSTSYSGLQMNAIVWTW